MKENILADKSYAFALEIIVISRELANRHEFVFAQQLLRSGTSIGANIREAIGAQSRKDFISKISIAHKEALETEYWLQLLSDSRIIQEEKAITLISQSKELIRLITRILLTSKANDASVQ